MELGNLDILELGHVAHVNGIDRNREALRLRSCFIFFLQLFAQGINSREWVERDNELN